MKMPQPNQSTRTATHLMLELAAVRKRLEAAEATLEQIDMLCRAVVNDQFASEILKIVREGKKKLKEASDG